MSKVHWLAVLGLAGLLAVGLRRRRRSRGPTSVLSIPPAASRAPLPDQLGGQGLDDVNAVRSSGTGVQAQVVEYHRRLEQPGNRCC